MAQDVIVKGNEINININHAKVEKVECKRDSITVTIGLYQGQQKISSHTMYSGAWVNKKSADYIEMTSGIKIAVESIFQIIRQQAHYQLNVLGRMLPETTEIEDL